MPTYWIDTAFVMNAVISGNYSGFITSTETFRFILTAIRKRHGQHASLLAIGGTVLHFIGTGCFNVVTMLTG